MGDTGASCHIFNDKEGFFDVEPITEEVKGVTGKIPAILRGKRKIQVCQADGTCTALFLNKCKFCPGARVSLFLINQELANGAKLSSDGLTLLLEYPNGAKISFDRQNDHQGWFH